MATQYAQISDLTTLGVYAAAIQPYFTNAEINAALLAASELFDGYIRDKFTLPLLSWGQDVIMKVVEVAAYYLFRKRGYNPNAPGDVEIRMGYEEAVAWMRDVSKGFVAPDVVDGSAPSAGSPVDAEVVTSTMRGWSSRGLPPDPTVGSTNPFGPFVDD